MTSGAKSIKNERERIALSGLALEYAEVVATEEDVIASLAEFAFYGRSIQEVKRYLASGKRCFVAKHNSRVVSCYWIVEKISTILPPSFL